MSTSSSRTKLCTFQIYENLIPKFNEKVTNEFGHYKKSKVMNALIQGYLTGRYRIINDKPSRSNNDYDMWNAN